MTESLLEAVLNLSHFHREHEKYYAQEPRANAVVLQRHARSLQALDVLDKVDFAPPALREDLSGPRRVPGYLHSAVELIGRAADLLSDSAGLVRDNERRWRMFRARVEEIVARDQ